MSKVPKEMGKKVQEELQKVLNEWTEQIPNSGYFRMDPKTQKIKRSEE